MECVLRAMKYKYFLCKQFQWAEMCSGVWGSTLLKVRTSVIMYSVTWSEKCFGCFVLGLSSRAYFYWKCCTMLCFLYCKKCFLYYKHWENITCICYSCLPIKCVIISWGFWHHFRKSYFSGHFVMILLWTYHGMSQKLPYIT